MNTSTHGCPFDMGTRDFYYGRQYTPRSIYPGEGEVLLTDPDKIKEYSAGWEEYASQGWKKDWG